MDNHSKQLWKNNAPPWSPSKVLEIGRQLIRAVERCHMSLVYKDNAYGFVHCDIKPDNIVFDSEPTGELWLIDFSLWTGWRDQSTLNYENRKYKHMGTNEWASRRVHNKYVASRACDIESICYVLLQLACGRVSFWFQENEEKGLSWAKVHKQMNAFWKNMHNIPEISYLMPFFDAVNRLRFDSDIDYKALLSLLSTR
jgi:serine/threonine protein kinase